MTERIAGLFPQSPGWTNFWKTLEFGREDLKMWVVGIIVLILFVGWLYRRDTVGLKWGWWLWLGFLRAGVLLMLLIVALAPQERRERRIGQISKAVLLVDTSASMGIRDMSPSLADATPGSPDATARLQAVQQLLENTKLLHELQGRHDVRIYTFDSRLLQQQLLKRRDLPGTPATSSATATAAGGDAAGASPATSLATTPQADAKSDTRTPPVGQPVPQATAANIKWSELLKAQGLETRLGDALLEVIRQEHGETLSGIVVFSDGGANAGADPTSAAEAALQAKTKLIMVGIGSTKRPVNLQVADLQAPTHAHKGDGFSLTAYVSGQGLAGDTAQIEWLTQREGEDDQPEVLKTDDVTLREDGVPEALTLEFVPKEAGRRKFWVRAKPSKPVQELLTTDNEDTATVEVTDRKTRVLLLAGGPMRDYQFVRNLLFRDKSIEMDVMLQTGRKGLSQESDKILFEFPSSREEMFAYDVVVAFDPDWYELTKDSPQALELLSEWVYSQAGGLILVAGDVNTTRLAQASPADRSRFAKLMELYPVVLDSRLVDIEEDLQQPWPFELTREGLEAGFLQLTDNSATSAAAWKEFPGVFRCFPTDGQKAGATIYARFADPRASGEPPILLAAQFFGSGRVLYQGSAESWRLRAVDEDYYDRLWIKTIREVGQGRVTRGTNRGILLLEKKNFALGSTVQVRARILDPQFKAYHAERVPIEIFDPQGKPLSPPVELTVEKNKPGNYSGTFIAAQPGNYKLELAVPESKDRMKEALTVKLPNLEFDRPEQNESLLRAVAREREGAGKYLTLSEAAAEIPKLLPDKSLEKIQFDFPRTLWDTQWMMYALVGFLTCEWLTRKLLKLA